MNDLIGFIVAFAALKVRVPNFYNLIPGINTVQISSKKDSPQDLSFGWQRSRLLGAFFNGVFLLALGVSIFLQSIERFVSVQGTWHLSHRVPPTDMMAVVEQPKLVLIVGCIGLGLNIISASFLHG